MKKIGIIVGTTRENRISRAIADWILSTVEQDTREVKYEIIDLREINLPLLDEPYPAATGRYEHEHTKNWSNLIKGFDAFVILTSEYNHGYPASLKNALDYLYMEWHNKPAALVGYGYSASGARAIEQLRQIVSNLRMKPLPNDLLISLVTSLQDGNFTPNENLVKSLLSLLEPLEKEI